MFFSKIPLVGLLSSFVLEALTSQNVNCQINEIVNTLLLAGDKFMPSTHLKQPAINHKIFETNSSFHTYSAQREKFNFCFSRVFYKY